LWRWSTRNFSGASSLRVLEAGFNSPSLEVERCLLVPAHDAGIVLCDEIVRFTNKHPRGGRKNHYRQALRRVTVARPEHDRPLVLATNDLASPAGGAVRMKTFRTVVGCAGETATGCILPRILWADILTKRSPA
jgi:hypothetical protein